MRKLLGSSSSRDEEVQIAEIVSVNLSRGSMNMVINKGLSDGVQFGDVVIDDAGVVGQISRAGTQTSLVLLITDKDHATPIQVRRNGQSSCRRHRVIRVSHIGESPLIY